MSRPAPADVRIRIVEIIGNSVYQALGLKESLEDEHRALELQDLQALRAAIANKSKCVAELQALEEQRLECCIAAGFQAGPEQMEQVTAWCDEGSELANCWQHLLDIAVECNAMNFTNGAIIRGRKQHIDTSLAVIRGGDTETSTYGRGGQGPGGLSQRSLAEA